MIKNEKDLQKLVGKSSSEPDKQFVVELEQRLIKRAQQLERRPVIRPVFIKWYVASMAVVAVVFVLSLTIIGDSSNEGPARLESQDHQNMINRPINTYKSCEDLTQDEIDQEVDCKD